MLGILAKVGRSVWYWSFLIILGIVMECIALYFQHVKGLGPCVLCIQTRIWVLAIILLALIGLGLRTLRWPGAITHLLMTGLFVGLLDRSWLLLGTERGFVFADCNFDLGLPSWLALQDWFPSMFMVQEACGYTPELLFGITMAEALLALSSMLVLIGAMLTAAAITAKTAD